MKNKVQYAKTENTQISYYKINSIVAQIELLSLVFPVLNINGCILRQELIDVPEYSEGLFVLPDWRVFGDTYQDALQYVISAALSSNAWNFKCRFKSDQLKCIERHTNTELAVDALSNNSGHDVFVLPAQFGKKHTGVDPRVLRDTVQAGEFCLDSISIISMLLTHRDRIKNFSDLWIDCSADMLLSHGCRIQSPVIWCYRDEIIYQLGWNNHWTGDAFGSPTGFL